MDRLTNIEPAELHRLVRTLVLCDSQSWTAASITEIVKALRYGLYVELVGKGFPGYRMLRRVVEQLGLEFGESGVPADGFHLAAARIGQQKRPYSVVALFPPMAHRLADIGVILPFNIQLQLSTLRERNPGFPEPLVSSLYLLRFWGAHFKQGVPIGPRVFDDLIAGEQSQRLCIRSSPIARELNSSVALETLQSLWRETRMYLGFHHNPSELDPTTDISLLPLSKHVSMVTTPSWRKGLAKRSSSSGPTHSPRFLAPPIEPMWMVKDLNWSVGQVGLVARNAVRLNTSLYQIGEDTRRLIRRCLCMRLEDRRESEIYDELGFEDELSYRRWTRDHHIQLVESDGRDWLREWRDACESLGLEPDPSLLEAVREEAVPGTETPQTECNESEPHLGAESSTSNRSTTFVRAGYTWSLNYRSVLTPTGDRFSFTERQAEVMAALVENWEVGTLDVSQQGLAAAVYGEGRRDPLKKLFNNDEVWNAMIRAGKRRGLIRLRNPASV